MSISLKVRFEAIEGKSGMKQIHGEITMSMAVLFAAAAGLSIGNLYWAQPLLAVIASGFGLSPAQGSILVTVTQIGYAIGIFAIVPLGDVLERRRLLILVMGVTVLALLICAFSPYFSVLAAGLSLLGLFSVSGQIILPLAGDMASREMRGKIIGIVSAGITVGILFSRFLSGIVASLSDWRAVYILAAILNILMVLLIGFRLSRMPAKNKIAYGDLLVSVLTSIRRYPHLKGILLKQGMSFGITFNLFWTGLTLLLTAEPYGYGTFEIGLVSLAGLTGAVAGSRIGILHDSGYGGKALRIFCALNIVCMLSAYLFQMSIAGIVLVAAIFSVSVQGISILCQTQLLSLSETERSRLNTVFVVSNFIFSAVGSGMVTILWALGGWQAISLTAASASLIALVGNSIKDV